MGRFNLSNWGIRHPQLVAFLILMIAAAGALAYSRLGRAEDPSFTIKNVNISAFWPGATAAEMQGQVADRIEKKLQELPYTDKIETYAKPGFTSISFVFKDSTPARDVPMLFLLLRKKMADVKADLPSDVIGPAVNDEFGDVDAVLYTIAGDGASYAQLKEVAEAFRKRLQRLPDVTKVDLYGEQGERIFVEFSHAKLATLGVSVQSVLDSLTKQNALASAGEFQTDAQRVPMRISGAVHGVSAIEETPVFANGQTFRLGDVARVTHGYEDPPSWLIRSQGRPALEIGIVMQKGGNILALGKALDATLADFETDLPQGIVITRIADQPKVVDAAVFEFSRSFLEALAIVLGVGFVTLGWRSGLVVATSVPLVLAIVFVAMLVLGFDLQRITLGALIIALGLLVDDAIIAVEAIVVKLEQGWDRERAASFAWTSTAFPMLTGTLVTAVGFMPIGLANSATGEYAGGIFWVVGVALVASWFVAVLFTPFLGYKFLPSFAKAGHRRDEEAIYATRFYRAFRRALEFCVSRPLVVIVLAMVVLGVGLSQFSKVQQQFFPLSERPELFFELRLAEGSAIGTTEKVAREAEKLIGGDEDASSYTTYIGKGSPRFWLGLQPVQPNESFAQIVIVAKDVQARERIKARIEAAVANGALSAARVRVDRFNFGPPVGFPVQFRVIGPDADQVREIAAKVRDVMRTDDRVLDAHLNWGEKMPSLRLDVDQARARAFGLTPQDIAQTLQTLIAGDDDPRRRRTHRCRRPCDSERTRGAGPHLGSDDRDARRRRGSDRPDRQDRAQRRGADHLAQGSRSRHHRARRRRRRRAAARCLDGAVAQTRRHPRSAAAGLSHRDRRRHRGIAEGDRVDRDVVPDHDPGDADPVDDPDAELLAARDRVLHRAARHRRGLARAQSRAQAVRFRRAARADRARGNGHAQHRDPGGPDRERRARARDDPPRRDRVLDDAPRAPGCADRVGGDPGDDPAVRERVLGPDGLYDHGRSFGRDAADAVPAARDLRAVVQKVARTEGRGGARQRRRKHAPPAFRRRHACGVRSGRSSHTLFPRGWSAFIGNNRRGSQRRVDDEVHQNRRPSSRHCRISSTLAGASPTRAARISSMAARTSSSHSRRDHAIRIMSPRSGAVAAFASPAQARPGPRRARIVQRGLCE
jgi:multidrug efflux pump subunit AcrB